jgi:hypothetical protein
LDPAAWLKETHEKLPTSPNSRIYELLPLAPEYIKTIKSKYIPEGGVGRAYDWNCNFCYVQRVLTKKRPENRPFWE